MSVVAIMQSGTIGGIVQVATDIDQVRPDALEKLLPSAILLVAVVDVGDEQLGIRGRGVGLQLLKDRARSRPVISRLFASDAREFDRQRLTRHCSRLSYWE